MRVLHVASHVINVGDGALNAVIQRRLRALARVDVDIVEADVVVDRPSLTAEDVDAFDLVIVGGGGAISAAAWNDGCGMALPMTTAELRRARTPFAVVGVGHNLFHGEVLPHASQLAETLAVFAERGWPFSVRNDGSLARLRRDVGPDATAAVVEVPDPGFFVAARRSQPNEAASDRFAVLQLAGDRPAARAGGRARPRWRRGSPLDPLLDEVAAFAATLVDDHGLEVLVAPHLPSDVPVVGDLFRRLPGGVRTRYAARPFRALGSPHPRHADQFFGVYAAAQLVVGMRGHAVICGVGLGTPTLALSTHPKVTGFMAACDLRSFVVEPGPGLADRLSTGAADLLGEGRTTYLERRAAATSDFAERLDAVLLEALQLVAGTARPTPRTVDAAGR